MKQMQFAMSLAAATVGTVLLVGCGKKTEQAVRVDPVKVKVMTVGSAESVEWTGTKYSGTVEEESGTSLSFSAAGTLTQLLVKVGDRVKKGQLIACIDATSMRNAYDMAHTTRLQAEDAYRRMKLLHDKGSLPEIKWVETQSQLQQAVAAENIARKSLADCRLYAPFSGVVSEKNAEVGQTAAPGMPIVKLVTTQVLNVKIAVPETEVADVQLLRQALVTVPALNGRTLRGHVVEKGIIADPISRSYAVKIRLTDTDRALLPGMVTQVSLATQNTGRDADIVIPAQLVQLADDNSQFVWVDEGGKAAKRAVTVGEYRSNGVAVNSGLRPGDRLIVEGQQKVCNGTKIANK